MNVRQFVHFNYFALLIAALLVCATTLDTFRHHHHYTPHCAIQYDEDFQQADSSSLDGEIQKATQFCDILTAYIVSAPLVLLAKISTHAVLPTKIVTPSAIHARASPA
jgi:hypothetical protein